MQFNSYQMRFKARKEIIIAFCFLSDIYANIPDMHAKLQCEGLFRLK